MDGALAPSGRHGGAPGASGYHEGAPEASALHEGVEAASEEQVFARDHLERLASGLSQMRSGARVCMLVAIAEHVSTRLRAGGTAFFCGNGGSAADAQHLAAELVGRQNFDRPPARGIALTVDTSALSAIGNDYGFDMVFARQLAALGRPGDVLFALSTSGRSPNVVAAMDTAAGAGMTTVAFTGSDPAALGGADFVFAAPASDTATVQQLHITAGHIVFAQVERSLFARFAGAGPRSPK